MRGHCAAWVMMTVYNSRDHSGIATFAVTHVPAYGAL